MHAQCPHCQSVVPVSAESTRQSVRCARCRRPFLAQPIPDVLPVEEEKDAPVAPVEQEYVDQLNLAPAVKRIVDDPQLAHLRWEQRVLYALLVQTFDGYYASRSNLFLRYLTTLLWFFPANALVFFGVVAALAAMLNWVGAAVGGWAINLLYVLPVATVVAFGLAFRTFTSSSEVQFKQEKDLIVGLNLGRFETIFRLDMVQVLGGALGISFAFQVGMLYFLPDHCGLETEGTLKQCVMMTLDNICHGIFLDTFELYDLTLGERVEHSYLSATVFYAFRLTFDALVAVALFSIWRRLGMRSLMPIYRSHEMSPKAMTDWLHQFSAQPEGWARTYFDEVMFLVAARKFLLGQDEVVWELTSTFPDLRVKKEIRELFTDSKNYFQFDSNRDS